MKKVEMTDFINGVATFNADPYCVEDEVMAQELFDETQGELEEITDVDDYEDAVQKLDLEGHTPKHINAEFIVNGSESIADYIIRTAENGTGYEEFFDDDELDETGEPSQVRIDVLKAYLNQNYNYLPNFRDGKRRIVLCNIIDFDEFQAEFNRQKAEKELPMLLNDAECVFEDGNCLMWIDDDNNVVNAAKNFLQSNRVKFIVKKS